MRKLLLSNIFLALTIGQAWAGDSTQLSTTGQSTQTPGLAKQAYINSMFYVQSDDVDWDDYDRVVGKGCPSGYTNFVIVSYVDTAHNKNAGGIQGAYCQVNTMNWAYLPGISYPVIVSNMKVYDWTASGPNSQARCSVTTWCMPRTDTKFGDIYWTSKGSPGDKNQVYTDYMHP